MRILVDADACPSKNVIERAAKENGIEVIMFCDINHILTSEYSEILYFDSGYQSVDMKIINAATKGDIVISQDYGLASLVLGKGCLAISPKGFIYTNENIDKLLLERHLSAKARKSKQRTKGPKKRTQDDEERFYRNLMRLIKP
ncbi:MAG: YaiI/YqxD family protein [Clostridiaceae bacterium]